MIRSLIKLAFLLAVGVLGYNYFLGTPSEKESAKKTINKAKEVGKDLFQLGKEEYAKFRSGKYDNALDEISNLFEKAKSTAEEKGGNLLEKMEHWEEQKEEWKEKKSALEELLKNGTDEDAEKNADAIKALNKEGKSLQKRGEQLQKDLEPVETKK